MARSVRSSSKKLTVQGALSEYEFIILGLSEQTQCWYIARLKRFADWCATHRFHVEELTVAQVNSYLQELRQPSKTTGRPLSSYTLHGHMRCIRTFLYWCAKPPQRYLSLEVPQNLVMPKVETHVIEPFTKQQIDMLHVAIRQNTQVGQNHFPIMGARNHAILDVLVDTGIRASELCDLRLCNVHLSAKDGYIKVMGKGRKEREVPLGMKSCKSLNDYIKHFRPAVGADEDHVFLTHRSEPMSVTALDQLFRRLGRHAKIVGVRCSPHTCRHTYALNFLLQGGDVYILSRLMGHTSVQVTEVYVRAVQAIQARRQGKSVLDNLS